MGSSALHARFASSRDLKAAIVSVETYSRAATVETYRIETTVVQYSSVAYTDENHGKLKNHAHSKYH